MLDSVGTFRRSCYREEGVGLVPDRSIISLLSNESWRNEALMIPVPKVPHDQFRAYRFKCDLRAAGRLCEAENDT